MAAYDKSVLSKKMKAKIDKKQLVHDAICATVEARIKGEDTSGAETPNNITGGDG